VSQGDDAPPQKIFGLAGWSGSGKTTLLCTLIPALIARGVTVSTIKHAHHTFDIDKPGKDSFEHRRAGATEVLIASARRWALMHENREGLEPTIEEYLARMTPVDLLLVEGLKREPHPKLEVHRPSIGKPLLCRDDPNVVAVASDGPIEDIGVPQLDLNDVEAIAAFILAHCGLAGRREAGS
jgi:molybdopterin-guanine dinucleotide biosynthesis protein B